MLVIYGDKFNRQLQESHKNIVWYNRLCMKKKKSYTLAKVVNLLLIFLTTGSIYFKWIPGLWLTKQKKMFYKSSAQNDLDFFLTNMLYKSVMLIRLVWKTNVFIGEIFKVNTWW